MRVSTSFSFLTVLIAGAFAFPEPSAASTKGIIGVFDDAGCSVNQRDLSGPERTCNKLPGQGLKIWWLEKGCGVVTIKNRECGGSETSIHHDWNECINIKDLHSWSIYCEP